MVVGEAKEELKRYVDAKIQMNSKRKGFAAKGDKIWLESFMSKN